MAGRISQRDVDEVKARTDISEIIGERVALKSAGVGAMKGLCPFHDERSPSFNVRPQAGFYHCFGCGESGDVYSFLRKMDHLSFTEAVERLAGRVGLTLHYEDGGAAPEQSGRSRLYAANAAAAEFFRAQLSSPDADTGRRFLGERGFDAGAAAHFGVGYAPQGWSSLHQAMRAKGFSDEELTNAGLVSQGQRGVYDRFRGRLVWPIRDVTGQVIGFGARRLFDDDKGPKYLNTPETTIYHKAQVLYGLDLAKRDISRQHRVVVVEGYTDVMACHLAGITTAVATCGTAFGSDHISVLRRVMGDDSTAGEVVFTFDPDAAGQKAALRAFADAKRFNAQTYVATGPEGLDPCDLRLQRGDAAVRSVIETKIPMVEFVIDQRIAGFDLASVEGRVGALRSAAPVVAELRDQLLQPEYVRVLARRLGLDTEDVRREVERASRAGRDSSAERNTRRTASADASSSDGAEPVARITLASLPRTSGAALERDALMGFLQFGHRMDAELLARAVAIDFAHPALDAVRKAIAAADDLDRPGWAADAVGTVREPYRSVGGELLAADFPALTDAAAVASTIALARRLVLRSIDRHKSELLGAIQRVAPSSEEGRAIRMQLRELDAERQRLHNDA
ncbi:DNA primase [Microbacterium marmarense]|uniref:DNA primase n=1 Tax=Microbacterium marmarense TaxID=3122051 RepID=A0ABU8LTH4_9MICO